MNIEHTLYMRLLQHQVCYRKPYDYDKWLRNTGTHKSFHTGSYITKPIVLENICELVEGHTRLAVAVTGLWLYGHNFTFLVAR